MNDVLIKQEPLNPVKAELPTVEDKDKMNDGVCHLEANLRHLIYSYDSEATESSSGGESCDEFDGYADTSYLTNQRERESKLYQRLKSQQSTSSQSATQVHQTKSGTDSSPPIKHRAKWAWLSNR